MTSGEYMKKIFLTLILCFILSGCSKEKYFICKIDLYNEIQKYELNAVYKVYYEKTFVTKIEKEEIYTSNEKNTINYFNEYKNIEYEDLSNLYGGIIYDVKTTRDKVKMTATIDMKLANIKKMVKNNYIDKDYVISGKLSVGGIKLIYKEKGAICDI